MEKPGTDGEQGRKKAARQKETHMKAPRSQRTEHSWDSATVRPAARTKDREEGESQQEPVHQRQFDLKKYLLCSKGNGGPVKDFRQSQIKIISSVPQTTTAGWEVSEEEAL